MVVVPMTAVWLEMVKHFVDVQTVTPCHLMDICIQDFADCVAEPTNLHVLLNNNLAGLGPDDGGPQDIEYCDFYELDRTVVKLKVTAQDSYTPYNVKYNDIAPDEFGQIGIITGTDVTLKFELLDQNSNELVDAIQKIAIIFYDLGTSSFN